MVAFFPIVGRGNGMCYCEHCRKNTFEPGEITKALPATAIRGIQCTDTTSFGRRAAASKSGEVGQGHPKARPEARYIANSGGGAASGLDMKKVGELAPTLFADRQCRERVMVPWANGKNGKEYRSTLGNKAIGGIFNVGMSPPYRWLNSTKSSAETKIWVQDGIANGLRPWFNMVSGQLRDRRGQQVIEDL